MRIFVTRRDQIQAALDLAAGKDRWTCCPIAQALRRRGFKFVTVDTLTIQWRHKGQFRRVATPAKASDWVERYDLGLRPASMWFEFEGAP